MFRAWEIRRNNERKNLRLYCFWRLFGFRVLLFLFLCPPVGLTSNVGSFWFFEHHWWRNAFMSPIFEHLRNLWLRLFRKCFCNQSPIDRSELPRLSIFNVFSSFPPTYGDYIPTTGTATTQSTHLKKKNTIIHASVRLAFFPFYLVFQNFRVCKSLDSLLFQAQKNRPNSRK